MYENLTDFLRSSPVAERVRLPARVVVQRTKFTPRELAKIRDQGSYGPVADDETVCELEAGGQVLARGRIVRRRGQWYFQIKEVLIDEEAEVKNERR